MNVSFELQQLTIIRTNLASLGFPQASREVEQAIRFITSLAKELAQYVDAPEVMDVMAVWEEIGHEHHLGDKLPGEGACEHREYVATTFTPFCVKWYTYAHHFLGYDDSLDWEFLPYFTASLDTYDVDEIDSDAICTALCAVMSAYNINGQSH